MSRHNEIKNAYKYLGKEATFYGGMITCSTFLGSAVCKLVWNMNKELNTKYLEIALSGISGSFSGKMLEVPVGTGVLTMPVYKTLSYADITCLDYSIDMMETAKKRADNLDLKNIHFVQGDVGHLSFEDSRFDLVLSLNGFHAFPDKAAAYHEIYRVLRPGGIFCGCFYIKGQNKRTDWFINHIYTPKGFFTPPFETKETIKQILKSMYKDVKIESVESMVCFACVKG